MLVNVGKKVQGRGGGWEGKEEGDSVVLCGAAGCCLTPEAPGGAAQKLLLPPVVMLLGPAAAKTPATISFSFACQRTPAHHIYFT